MKQITAVIKPFKPVERVVRIRTGETDESAV